LDHLLVTASRPTILRDTDVAGTIAALKLGRSTLNPCRSALGTHVADPFALLLRALGLAFDAHLAPLGTAHLLRAAAAAGLTLGAAATAHLLPRTAAAIAAHLRSAAAARLLWPTTATALNLCGATPALVAAATAAATLAGLRQDRRGKGQRRSASKNKAVFHEPELLSEAFNG
jgi:hypothetical protein